MGAKARLKEYFERNPGRAIPLSELQKVAGTHDFTRMIRFLKEEGLPIQSYRDNENLQKGEYLYGEGGISCEGNGAVSNQILHLRARIEELEKSNQTLRKSIGKQEELAAQVARAIQAAKPLPTYYHSPSTPSKNSVTAVTMWSDEHIGEVIQADETEGFGEYCYAVAERRFFGILDNFIKWVDTQRNAYCIDDCAVLALGDHIAGDIHRELSVTNEFPVPVQTAKAGLLLGEGLRRLSAHFKNVTVYEVGADNHGRLTPKPQTKQKSSNNMSYLVHTIANVYAEQCPNVKPIRAPGMKMVAEIAGWRFLLEHGDVNKSWMGLPYYSMSRERGREAFKRMNTDKTFDFMCQGHWHSPSLIEGNIIINGALSGTSEYDHACGRQSPPCQVAFLVHPEHKVFNIVTFYA